MENEILREQIKWIVNSTITTQSYYVLRSMICETFGISKQRFDDIQTQIMMEM